MLRYLAVLGAVVVLASSGSAQAGPWANPSGSAANFSYSNGQDLNGYFGEPLVWGDTFYFTAANFVVNAQNGGTQAIADTVSFDIQLNPDFALSLIRVRAFGSYNVQGQDSYVDFNAFGSVTELGGSHRTFSGPILPDPPVSFPIYGNNNGQYSVSALVDVSYVLPPIHDSLHLSFSNNLLAYAAPGGNAVLDLRYQDLVFEVTLIPEPATLGLLVIPAVAVLRRRFR